MEVQMLDTDGPAGLPPGPIEGGPAQRTGPGPAEDEGVRLWPRPREEMELNLLEQVRWQGDRSNARCGLGRPIEPSAVREFLSLLVDIDLAVQKVDSVSPQGEERTVRRHYGAASS
jgi:hypothetical protein